MWYGEISVLCGDLPLQRLQPFSINTETAPSSSFSGWVHFLVVPMNISAVFSRKLYLELYSGITVISRLTLAAGLIFCIAIWVFAIGGVIIEAFFLEKFSKISVFLYLAMGWVSIFTLKPLYESMGWGGILYLFLGGLSYSLGTIFYKRKYHNFYHVVWHLFVLAGAIFMFLAVFKYL